VFSTPEANVESRNLRHSLARSDSILLAGTSLTLLETLRNVRGSKVQVISCEKYLLLNPKLRVPFGALTPLFGGNFLFLVTKPKVAKYKFLSTPHIFMREIVLEMDFY
jgi:hypothetical protein